MSSDCECAQRFDVRLARPDQYSEFKRILNLGRYPAFVGRAAMSRNAVGGGALFWAFDEEIIGVSLVNPHLSVLLALNVVPAHRAHGLGSVIVRYLMPNFVRAIDSRVPWFAARGYRCIGEPKLGRSLTTQIMARTALFELAGKLRIAWPTVS